MGGDTTRQTDKVDRQKTANFFPAGQNIKPADSHYKFTVITTGTVHISVFMNVSILHKAIKVDICLSTILLSFKFDISVFNPPVPV